MILNRGVAGWQNVKIRQLLRLGPDMIRGSRKGSEESLPFLKGLAFSYTLNEQAA